MKEAYNKFSLEKIEEICNDKNLTYINHYWDREQQETIVSFICNQHQKYGMQEKRLYDIQRQKRACPYCNHSKLKETYKEEIESIHPNIEVISEYLNWDTPLLCRCKVDGNVWSARISSLFIETYMCKECRKRVGNAKRKTLEKFKEEMFLVNDNIEVVDDKYLGTHKPIRCRCKIHKVEWESYPCNLLNQTATCPACAKESMREKEGLTQEEFIKRVADINPDIEVLGTYTNSHNQITFKCKKHNCTFQTSPRTFLYKGGCGCPLCTQSVGEKKMLEILKDKGFSVISQHTFDDCRHINVLRFDGYDIENNIAYEYQGAQHYHPVDFAGKGDQWASEQFELLKKRDLIKLEYCKNNNIPLIQVPYWEFDNMDSFITTEIKKIIA